MAINSQYKVNSGGEAVNVARQWIGTAYCWSGGHGPTNAPPRSICVDCSGLVDQVFGGPTQGSTTFTQIAMGTKVANIAQAGPGDLILFGPIGQKGEPHHVGIYVGNNQMIDAPDWGIPVGQRSISGYGPINGIRRLVPTSGGGTGDGGNPVQTTFNYAQLEGIWILASGPAQYAAMAAAIATAESGGNSQQVSPPNTDGSVDRGLWQINSKYHGTQSSLDIMTNARGAVDISNRGTYWNPWCTAWSDGACGHKGGSYLGAGSPYQKYLQTNTPPDMSVANLINGTNAVTPGAGQDATLTSLQCNSLFEALASPLGCVAADVAGGTISSSVGSAISSVIKYVLNPLIQASIAIMGMTSGAVMVMFGLFLLVRQTDTGKAATGAAMGLGATALGQPEIGAAIGSVPRPVRAYSRQQARAGRMAASQQLYEQRATGTQQRFAARSQMIGARQAETQRLAGERQQGVIAARTAGQQQIIGVRGREQRGVIRTRTATQARLINLRGEQQRGTIGARIEGQSRIINERTTSHGAKLRATTAEQTVRRQIADEARAHNARTRGKR